jgi:carbon-monoxide dehydrogenase medium subunit
MKEIPMSFPTTVAEAVAQLAETDGARPLGGGTDLWIKLDRGAVPTPTRLVVLQRVAGYDDVQLDGGGLRLGGGVTLATIAADPRVREAAPALAAAAGAMASPQVRSRGTIGGNLCNASPAADLMPPLLVHEAEAIVAGPGGERRVGVAALLTGPGKTSLRRGEIVTAVVVPRLPAAARSGYIKHQVGVCGGLSIVSVAVAVTVDEATGLCTSARVALGAVAPTPVRAPEAEAALVGRPLDQASVAAAAAAASGDCLPIDDVRASCDHRHRMVEVLLPRVIRAALEGENPGGLR